MKKRVLVWITLGNHVGREVFRGIYQYAQIYAPDWEIMHIDRIQNDLDTVLTWEFDGLIGPFNHRPLAEAVEAACPCCVNLHGCAPFNRIPQVGTDDVAIGAVAADYFLQHNVNHFGYFGFPGLPLSDARWEGFRRRLESNGKTAVQFTLQKIDWSRGFIPDSQKRIRPELKKWLLSQPRPFALFVVDDPSADIFYDLCRENNLSVPDDIALLGVNDDDVYCYRKNPPLSSIQVPSRMAGYRAAQTLDRILKTNKTPKKPLFLEPGGVIERASTISHKLDDDHVTKALRFIAENAVRGISTEEIARAAGLSRRVLEKRFRILLNSSPQAEVRRAQIKQAKNALRETNLSLEEIAEATGLTSGNYLSQIFKKATGQTPGTYRRNFR